MGKTREHFPEKRSDSLLEAGGALTVEFYPTATQCSGSGTATATLNAKDKGGIPNGAEIYVGTRASSVTVQSGAADGGGAFVIDTLINYADGDAIILKDIGGDDLLSEVYSTQNFDTTTTNPVSVTADNELNTFLKSGLYGRRILDSSSNVLESDNDIRYGDTVIHVTPQHNSATAGIEQAINKLPANGGTIMLGAGTFQMTEGVTIPANTRIMGSGRRVTTILKKASSSAFNLLFPNGNNIEIRDLGVNGNISNNANTQSNSNIIWNTSISDLIIRDCYLTESTTTAIAGLSTSGSSTTRARIFNNFLEDNGWRGIEIKHAVDCYIGQNDIVTCGSHGISISFGTTLATDYSRRCRIIGNYVNREAAPTDILSGAAESGFMIHVGGGSEDIIVSGNLCWDNVTANDDGIAVNQQETKSLQRILIDGNTVYKGGNFGIDAAESCVISNNMIYRPRTHGIAAPFGEAQDYTELVISGNSIVDPNEGGTAITVAGIAVQASDSPDGTASTVESVVIQGNIVRDSRSGNSGTINGVSLTTDSTSSIANCVIIGNDFSDCSKGIRWIGTNFTGRYKIRDNVMPAGDPYSGQVILSSGTASVQNTNWPAVTFMKFTTNIIHVNQTTSSEMGIILGEYDGTDTLTISTFKDGAGGTPPLVAADLDATILWRFIGTED